MRFYDGAMILVICTLAACFFGRTAARQQIDEPKYSSLDLDNIHEQKIYLKATATEEIVVVSAANGSIIDIQPNDYITHIDGVKVFSGGLTAFLLNGDSEAIIPIVDDEDLLLDGNRLLGFLKIQSFSYQQKSKKYAINLRRGEYIYDNSETALDRSLLQPGQILPQHGGGKCITSKDCYFGNGTCIHDTCHCYDSQTGPQCQIRCTEDESTALKTLRKAEEIETAKKESIKSNAELSTQSGRRKDQQKETQRQQQTQQPGAEGIGGSKIRKRVKGKLKIKPKPKPGDAVNQMDSHDSGGSLTDMGDIYYQDLKPIGNKGNRGNIEDSSAIIQDENTMIDDRQQTTRGGRDDRGGAAYKMNENKIDENDAIRNNQYARDERRNREDKEQTDSRDNDRQKLLDQQAQLQRELELEFESEEQGREYPQKTEYTQEIEHIQEVEEINEEIVEEIIEEEPSVENLYGYGKRYPEPYLAGKPPNELVHMRQQSQREGKSFVYAVRFRMGPLGLSFDNRIPDATVVERLVPRMQSAMSDIQVGDIVIAVDQFDTTTAPAKATQRIIASLSWPLVIVFETRHQVNNQHVAEESMKKRLFNLNIIYPPSLVTSAPLQILLADWTSNFNISDISDRIDKSDTVIDGSSSSSGSGSGSGSGSDSNRISSGSDSRNICPIYLLKTAGDLFGCEIQESEFKIPQINFQEIQTEPTHPMLSMLSMGADNEYSVAVRSLALMKRGVCAFTEKAKGLMSGNADLGIVVNTDDTLTDMPAGKEEAKTSRPLAIMKEKDGSLLHQAAVRGEVLAIISDPDPGPTSSCDSVLRFASDILNRWPHSVPFLPIQTVLDSKPGTEIRPASEQGGRIAVSGDNGWAYFDYHLAMFGPSEVPVGSYRLQMAYPPSGCDPSAYTVRIKGTVVALLRGGGCSFGIKVINAQKLGAVAVIVVNTDESKTMRIMASNDEVPLINIPCIMVSRRLQSYLEDKLTKYYLSNQHFISFDPTGMFGEYESKSITTSQQRH